MLAATLVNHHHTTGTPEYNLRLDRRQEEGTCLVQILRGRIPTVEPDRVRTTLK